MMNKSQCGASWCERLRRIATVLWLSVTTTQLVIWALISVIDQRLAIPFWLWSAAAGGVIVGALWAAEGAYRTRVASKG